LGKTANAARTAQYCKNDQPISTEPVLYFLAKAEIPCISVKNGGEILLERSQVIPLRSSASAILHSIRATGRAKHSFVFIGDTLVTAWMTL
jgi:hypothetical protein